VKKRINLIAALMCWSSYVYAGGGNGAPVQPAADGLIEFEPPQAVCCIAVRVEVPEGEMVTGLRWHNGTSSIAFPKILVASGNGMTPPPYADAVIAATDVFGQEYQWSEILFNEPVASQSGTLFILLQYPANYSPAAGELALGVAYAIQPVTEHYYLTGDGIKWIKVSMNCHLLLTPILANRVPGVISLRANGPEVAEPEVTQSKLVVAPNPFNPQTSIDLYLTTASTGSVHIYDIRGRMVRDLYRGRFVSGRNSFVWRGRDSRGRSVASGLYYVKVTAGRESFTNKLMLLK